MDRSHCGQKVFGGCPGADCERQCSATIWIPPSKTPLGRQMLKTSRLTLWLMIAAVCTVFTLSAVAGLSRAETAFQQDRV